MKFSFLGYSVKKIMELNLDLKDLAILRYFDDFRKSGKMNYEFIEEVKYYWISYKNIAEELPFLGLGKKSIMVRMLKLRDLGILSHYTKKEGGTFSYYAPGERYNELLYVNNAEDYDDYNDNSNNDINETSEKSSISDNKNNKDHGWNSYNKATTKINTSDINNTYIQGNNSYKNNNLNNSKDYNTDAQVYANYTDYNTDSKVYDNYENYNTDSQIYDNYEDYNTNGQVYDNYEDSYNKNIKYNKNEDAYNYHINDFNDSHEENPNIVDGDTMNIIKNNKYKSNVNSNIVNNETTINDAFNKNSTPNKAMITNEEYVKNNVQGNHNFRPSEYKNPKNEEPLYLNNHKGYAEKCPTKINLLNNSSTKLNNLYNNIKENIYSIISYLNLQVGVMYKVSNSRTINLVKARLKDGFTVDDFKTVIDKKVKAWKGTLFEQYLTPFTLFGEKFEIYLNQNIPTVSSNNSYYGNKNNYKSNNQKNTKNLRFHNFKGRDYDYDDLEKKLLGWD